MTQLVSPMAICGNVGLQLSEWKGTLSGEAACNEDAALLRGTLPPSRSLTFYRTPNAQTLEGWSVRNAERFKLT